MLRVWSTTYELHTLYITEDTQVNFTPHSSHGFLLSAVLWDLVEGEKENMLQDKFHCWGWEKILSAHSLHATVSMSDSHLVCMFTVISTGAHTVFRGLGLLFGRLSEEVVFSCTCERSSPLCYYLVWSRWPQANTAAAAAAGSVSAAQYLMLQLRLGERIFD